MALQKSKASLFSSHTLTNTLPRKLWHHDRKHHMQITAQLITVVTIVETNFACTGMPDRFFNLPSTIRIRLFFFFCISITNPAKQFDDIWLTGDYIPKHSMSRTDVIVENHTIPLKRYNGQQRPNAKLQNELFVYLAQEVAPFAPIQRRTFSVLLRVLWILIVKSYLGLSSWGVLTLKRAKQSDVI